MGNTSEKSGEKTCDERRKHVQQRDLLLGATVRLVRARGRGMPGILCLVVRGQHGRAAGHALERGIAEIDLALNVDAVVEQRELTLELGRAVPDVALLRLSRAIRAETDVERNVARRDRLLPPD